MCACGFRICRGRRAAEERRRPPGFRRNQNWRGRASLRVRASAEHRRRAAGIGRRIVNDNRPRISTRSSRIRQITCFMLLLAIDTSGKQGSIALARAGERSADGDIEVIEIVPLDGRHFFRAAGSADRRTAFQPRIHASSIIGAFAVVRPGIIHRSADRFGGGEGPGGDFAEADRGGFAAGVVRVQKRCSEQGDVRNGCGPERCVCG